jgi:hypothetical protein
MNLHETQGMGHGRLAKHHRVLQSATFIVFF